MLVEILERPVIDVVTTEIGGNVVSLVLSVPIRQCSVVLVRRRGMGDGLLLRRKAKPALALLRRLNPHVEIGAGEAMQFPTVGTRRFWLAPGIV